MVTSSGAVVGSVNPLELVFIEAKCEKTGNGSWEMTIDIGQCGNCVHSDSGVPIGADKASSVTADGAVVGVLTVDNG